MFTARNAMLISFVIAMGSMIYTFRFRNLSIRTYSLSVISIFSVIGTIIFLPLIQYSFFDGSGELNIGPNIQLDISRTYARGTFEDLTTNHLKIPSEELEVIFGNAQKPNVDPGYTRLINTLGLVGMLIHAFSYILALVYFASKYKLVSLLNLDEHERNSLQILIGVLVAFILLVFIFNLKHFFFFTRGFYEILLIIGFFCLQFINTKQAPRDFKANRI